MNEILRGLVEQARKAYEFNPSAYTFAALNEALKVQASALLHQRLSY